MFKGFRMETSCETKHSSWPKLIIKTCFFQNINLTVNWFLSNLHFVSIHYQKANNIPITTIQPWAFICLSVYLLLNSSFLLINLQENSTTAFICQTNWFGLYLAIATWKYDSLIRRRKKVLHLPFIHSEDTIVNPLKSMKLRDHKTNHVPDTRYISQYIFWTLYRWKSQVWSCFKRFTNPILWLDVWTVCVSSDDPFQWLCSRIYHKDIWPPHVQQLYAS